MSLDPFQITGLLSLKHIAWGNETVEIEHPRQSGQMGGMTLKIMGGVEDQEWPARGTKKHNKEDPLQV